MDWLEQLYHLYDAYEKKSEDVHKKAPRYAGILGLGNDPRNHECHEIFYEDVRQWVQDFLGSEPSREEVVLAVRWILESASGHRNSSVYGYLYAAQRHVMEMIPKLSREESLQLLEWYDAVYPAEDRFPVQQEVCRLLREKAGMAASPKRRRLMDIFRWK